MSVRRIIKQVGSLQREPTDCLVLRRLHQNDLYSYQGTILGPKNSPYEGGIFFLNVTLPEEYPFAPPKCTFTTKVYHPNINSNGVICLLILQNRWSPALTIKSVLLAIQSLFIQPDPFDSIEPQIERVYTTDREQYEVNAKQWTNKYAK